jgi:hypothetical protein
VLYGGRATKDLSEEARSCLVKIFSRIFFSDSFFNADISDKEEGLITQDCDPMTSSMPFPGREADFGCLFAYTGG